jgi:hypothetical protein
MILPHTDYVLFCVKSSDPQRYFELTQRHMDKALLFWDELERRGIKYWVRIACHAWLAASTFSGGSVGTMGIRCWIRTACCVWLAGSDYFEATMAHVL